MKAFMVKKLLKLELQKFKTHELVTCEDYIMQALDKCKFFNFIDSTGNFIAETIVKRSNCSIIMVIQLIHIEFWLLSLS